MEADKIDDWMAASGQDTMLLASTPPSMEAYRACRAVNTPRNNAEQLLTPVG
ncbi:hypothetical protein [Stenotrophomonas sp. ESTM1D_MKCIP4_1]|uniref:hypothetical protein n=1 Tax=Stenotrophomonas sp. ESTM1D_MKCIP4_1 TaxID=2072414 RepID=UPI00131EE687|nr:hypothetical protein [Stenotrophomonas sp. ESTM1D_MKCIP4_1]